MKQTFASVRNDWSVLLALAADQRVAPFLYHRITSQGWSEAVQADVLVQLRESYRASLLRNMGHYGEVRRVAECLQGAGIPVLLLKGAFLAATVYEHLALREMNDIDILVPQHQLPQAAALVQTLGYKPARQLSIVEDMEHSHHLPVFLRRPFGSLELHWNITRPTDTHAIDPTELWRCARPATIAGMDLLGLAPEDLLLHLCIHTSYQHQFAFGLRPFCDIAYTIEHYADAIDWNVLVGRCRQWGWQRGVYLAFTLAHELLGAAVPHEVLDTLRPSQINTQILAVAHEQIFTEKPFANSMPPKLAALGDTKNVQRWLSTLRSSIFVSTYQLSTLYQIAPDSPAIYLYYFVRTKDLLVRYSRQAFRLQQGDEQLHALARRKNALSDWLADG